MSGGDPHVVVVGAGFAGIAAALRLADAGVRVTLVEGRGSLGGRARSRSHPDHGHAVDNGQHVLLGAYHATTALCERLGTADRLLAQPALAMTWRDGTGDRGGLRCARLPAPLHLGAGLLGLPGVGMRDLLAAARLTPAVADPVEDPDALDRMDVDTWLRRLGQTRLLRERLWDGLCLATLNARPEESSALLFQEVLRQGFLGPPQDGRIVLVRGGLSDLHGPAVDAALADAGGTVRRSTPALGLETSGDRVTAVRVRGPDGDEESLPADAVITAVPHTVLPRLLDAEALGRDPRLTRLHRLGTSPILTVVLWYDRPVWPEDAGGPLDGQAFFGVPGAGPERPQWVFNRNALDPEIGDDRGVVALVISAPDDTPGATARERVRWGDREARVLLPRARAARLVGGEASLEKRATWLPRPGLRRLRPGPVTTAASNLFLAGDWTDTGLPATIEGATRSGESAAAATLWHLAGAAHPPAAPVDAAAGAATQAARAGDPR